jgi:hypothetical protein
MAKQIEFKENDIVYMVDKKNNKILTDKKYNIRKIEFENGGNFDDLFEETYFAYLEDIDSGTIEKKIIIYKHFRYNLNYVYISKVLK